jgi:hypothetical protein
MYDDEYYRWEDANAFDEEYLQCQCAGISSNPIDLEEYEL